MAYATQQDIVDRFGEDELFVIADRDHDGAIDSNVVTGALDDATDEINAYVGQRYHLPVVSAPPVLTRLCVDIALYRLSSNSAAYTEEKRQRYEDALRFLDGLATGRFSLGLSDGSQADTSVGEVEMVSAPRRFSRRTMGRLK